MRHFFEHQSEARATGEWASTGTTLREEIALENAILRLLIQFAAEERKGRDDPKAE